MFTIRLAKRSGQTPSISALFSTTSKKTLRSPNEDDATFFKELMGDRKGCVVTNPIEINTYNQDWTVSKEKFDFILILYINGDVMTN